MGKTHFNMTVSKELAVRVGEARRECGCSRPHFYSLAAESLLKDMGMEKRGYEIVYRNKDNPEDIVVKEF